MIRLPRLHVLTDTTLQTRFSHVQLAEAAFAFGGVAVQYREKRPDFLNLANEIEVIARLACAYDGLFIVNDYFNLALSGGAGGVHVGRGDMSLSDVFIRKPADWIVGATVHNEAEYEEAARYPVDYIGVGPVFGTQSKQTGLPPLGLAGLRRLCALSNIPVIAIGGITADNIAEVMDCGVYGVALLSEVCLAPEPQAAVERLMFALSA